MTTQTLASDASAVQTLLKKLKIDRENPGTSTGQSWSMASKEEMISSTSPVDGASIGSVSTTTNEEYAATLKKAHEAFVEWRKLPAPRRGAIVYAFGEILREEKDSLGALVSYEMGKSLQEGLGEVQEMIDICDFAVGLSRQLHGLTMHSERPNHRMYEQYHPLGIVGIITAFNFPVAVWAWNAMIALVCGNVCVWKPSEKTPLCAVACQKLFAKVLEKNNLPEGISCVVNGGAALGQKLAADTKVPLVSATGSTRMGKSVATTVAQRLGKSLLELGGNNAIIITPNANLELALVSTVFGAVGTAGQRCTSTRRLLVHGDVYDEFKSRLTSAYKQLRIGNPLDANTHVGPLIDQDAVSNYQKALQEIEACGGSFVVQGEVLSGEGYESGCYVKPAIAEVENHYTIVQEETFAPILYLIKYTELDHALEMQNDVKQGLSSAIMTNNLQEAEQFLSANGSDCGIANVNIGTSGAEIGGAFGGEKETGGGRESGSDAWKFYMRRQTNTINFGTEIPLAQGIEFKLS